MKTAVSLALALMVLAGCGREKPAASSADGTATSAGESEAVFDMPSEPARDKFTYANYEEVRVADAALDLEVDFATKTLTGSATLDLDYLDVNAERIVLDTHDLTIYAVEEETDAGWTEAEFEIGADDPLLGAPLTVSLDDKPDRIRIRYRTSPEAEGLQWLSPAQTAGGEHPFLFSQFQPIFARTMAPLQDTPAVRMTYSARIKTPPELIAVMGAAQDPDGERDGDYSFEMPQPIPSYLLAIAVGDIAFEPINDHIGVYAEEYIVDEAAAEFEDTPAMEEAIAELYGPYRWGRYDMIVLPPSFPFGGMENPRLSFLTPTLIAGDKSLTNVVAHELAHSWSGNLVTNATWRDAWLNEGFTSYVENRVMEALYGEDRAVMERALDLENLRRTVEDAERPALTALKMPADIAHPDDAFSQVSYAGGMFFLKFLEERFGRDRFDAFLREYFDAFAFESITTEEFLGYFEDGLWADDPDAVSKAEIDAWVYEPGLPDTLPIPQSDAFERVSAAQAEWLEGDIEAGAIDTAAWTTHEWLHFINTLPDDLAAEQFNELDEAFSLTGHPNAEIAFAWHMQAIAGGYEPATEALEAFLLRVGRGKFIYRLYDALIDADRADFAGDVYARARPGYHPIAQRRIDDIFEEAGLSAPVDGKSVDEINADALADIDVEACEAGGGEVRAEGLLGAPRCVTPYPDAGEICSDASDCEGRCLGADDVTDFDAPDGEARGICEADDSPFGCFSEIRNGVAEAMICVD